MHFIIRFEPPLNKEFHNIYPPIIPTMPNVEIKKGDTVIFRGEETLTRREFYKIADELTKKGVDIIMETTGITFSNSDNLEYIFNRYKVKEILIKIYSHNFPENDKFFRHIGTSMMTVFGLKNLLEIGFKNISVITYIIDEKNYLNRLKTIYDFKKEKGLKYLYIELDSKLSIEKRISIFKEILVRFGEADDVILRNNDFEIRLRDEVQNNVEIKTDKENGILNLVLRNFCTNNCTFCTTRIVQSAFKSPLPFDSKDRVLKAIQDASKNLQNRNVFEIVAVEPLEHPDIISILKKANECGFKSIRLLTHGRLLKNEKITNELKRLGVKEIIIPIAFYSPESATLNVGDPNAFNDMVELLELIRNYRGIDFKINIMISKQNYQDIYKIVRFLKNYGVRDFNFNLALPSIEDERFYEPYAVKFSELVETISVIPEKSLKNKILNSLIYIIPACVVNRFFGDTLIKNIKKEYEILSLRSISAQRMSARYKLTRECKKRKKCPFGEFCVGVNEIYIKLFGDKEFYY